MRLILAAIAYLYVALPAHTAFAAASVNWAGKSEGPGWTFTVRKAILDQDNRLANASPSDMGRYCPNYGTLTTKQKRLVWAKFFSLLANYESGYDPALKFTESFPDAEGNLVVSRGLLQLSKESANGYGCAIGAASELHDPAVNLRCAVRIASKWVVNDGVIARKTDAGKWHGLARYWSPFRSDEKRADIATRLSAEAECKMP